MAFRTTAYLQDRAIGWLRKGCSMPDDGTAVGIPRNWMACRGISNTLTPGPIVPTDSWWMPKWNVTREENEVKYRNDSSSDASWAARRPTGDRTTGRPSGLRCFQLHDRTNSRYPWRVFSSRTPSNWVNTRRGPPLLRENNQHLLKSISIVKKTGR